MTKHKKPTPLLPPKEPFVPHVVKTMCIIDKVKQAVNVGLRCDVCGEIQLPPIPYDHIAAFARLLVEVHHQLQTPGFAYYTAGPSTTSEHFEKALDYSQVISEVLKMSKVRKGQG